MMGDKEVSDRDWLIQKQMESYPGMFLDSFIRACLHADEKNWAILLPALKQIREIYPLAKKPLNEKESHGQ